MKNKPIRHKEDNKFKFQPFAERIANIDVDIFHRVAHPNEADSEDIQTHFYQALEKWNVLNLTVGYDEFCKEVRGIITLPQLLHKKDYVVEVLIKHLKLKNPLYLQPLLEFVVALAKDLTKEFYPYYPSFLNILIELLNLKDNEVLEWTFQCLAYLFKFLWRFLIKDIDNVFTSLLPLLSDTKPPYIQNFAAESFSFVARKVKDKPSFLKLILETVKSKQDAISGCGKLLFDVIRGVTGHFHSCAENTLQFYFESVCNENIPQDILFDVLQQVIVNMVTHIHTRNSEIFWKSIIFVIDKFESQYQNNKSEKVANNLELLLKLLILTLQIKQGRFLNSPDILIKLYMKLISVQDFPENVLLSLSKIGSLILISQNIQLSQEHASSLIRKTLLLENKSVVLDFIVKLTTYSAFEPLVLPVFLKYFSQSLDPTAFRVLAEIILEKSPICQSGIGLASWKKYPLDFGSNAAKVLEHLLSYVADNNISKISRDEFIYSLIILPHVNAANNKEIFKSLVKTVEIVHKEIKLNIEDNSKDNLQKLLFLLSNIIECIVHIIDSKSVNTVCNLQNHLIPTLLDLSESFPYTVCCLRIIDIITTSCESTSFISYENLKNIDKKLLQFWSSPFHQIRLLVSHIYTQFENVPELNTNTENESWKIFSLCHNTESIEPLVHTYRDQLNHLAKLAYDKTHGIICQKSEFNTVPLRYFLGALYMNFQLLWDPIINLIESYAHGMNIPTFWQVFSKELKSVVIHIKDDIDVSFNNLVTEVNFISELYTNMFKVDNKPDFVNYRILLWKAMISFSDIAEMKSKDISSLMLSFIEDEYRKNNIFEALTWNIKQTNNEVVVDDEEEVDEKDEDEVIKKKLLEPVPYAGKSNLKMLMTSLTLLSKIRNPKTLYREPELYKLYLDFLSHRNEEIQKLSLDCIMVYKHKYLLPYKDNLYSLVDDKKFKNQLALFRIDKETTVVQEDHRKELLPIVLRIVHSKMITKTGMKTGGKASGQFRRNLVLRFLAGCHEEEMLQFIHMSFRHYSNFLHDDPEVMVKNVIESINLEKFIPPKRLQSTLNLLQIVLEQFGGLMGKDLLNYLLKILMIIGAAVLGAFLQKNLVHGGYISALRNIRTTCQSILARFFDHFENYLWSKKELNAIFDVFIWPYLEKLTVEGIHSPTPILKLFHQWAMNPRYFVLLVKHEKDNPNQYVLPHIIKLFVTPKVHPTVSNTILEMLEKLLLLKEDDDEEGIKRIPDLDVEYVVPIADNIKERLKLNEELNYGSCILLPYVTDVLEKFKRKLSNKNNKGVNQRELFIMSRISELVWEPETCDIVLSLVIPMVVKKASGPVSEDTILQLVQTIYNLIKTVHEPHIHLRKISPLFAEVTSVPTRKLLCELLMTISSTIDLDILTTTSKLIHELNAFNKKWLDQPDFDRRHQAFKLVDELIQTDKINFELGAIIIYNCFYFIRNENDLALRESSKTCLRSIVPYMINKYQLQTDKDYLLNDILFQMIRKGIKSKNENFRQETISLLGHMARECPDSHVVLKDLNLFTNKQDLEVDFFENIMHLQLYRQTRALNKFNQICKELVAPLNARTCTNFILPLVSSYLLTEKYSQKNSLIDGAIEAVKTICCMLPWHHYDGILKYYLGQLRHKLDFQRQLVKLTVAILDAYHYDLSKAYNSHTAEEVMEVIPENKTNNVEEKNEEDNDESKVSDNEQEPGIDEILDAVPEEEIVEEEPNKVDNIPAVRRITVLSPSAAKRVIFSIKTILLPQLNKALAEMTHYEGSHKLNRKKTGIEREEEELQKVPISLAVVKLLQKLPTYILNRNLPGVFLKTCTFLKSHLDSVRRVTRETLQKIMATLGPKYLSSLINEMSSLLSRGFQVHVLVYTIHSVLVSLKELFEPTDIDKCLLSILNVCKIDLFGNIAEEKEVDKITRKVSEAKSTKSYDTFQILAQYITEKCLMDLLIPLKEVLVHSHSFKIVNKVHECLRRIVLGLVDNDYISVESLLVFAYGTSSESIPQFIASNDKPKLTEKELEKKAREKPDCFIIPKPPVYKSGFRFNHVKNSLKTNAHLLVEFGLRLCYFVLKRDKIKVGDYMKYVDPFVIVFKNCLSSRHVKMCTLTINCLSWILKYEIPSMKQNIKEITGAIFELLHKYAAAGLSKGDNFDLVVAAFKAMAILVRDVKYYTVTNEQLKALLLYAEQDLHDFERQATAFGLLKAIIGRKLIISEIHAVMDKVAKLSITSDLPHVRLQCRQVFHQFMMDYPLGKKLDKHLSFFMNQLSYELEPGRASALEMVYGFIHSFPEETLKQQAGMFFVMLGARLVNDESPECRKMVSKCLQTMLEKLDKNDRDLLFDIVLQWFKDKKLNHRRLAAQMCGIIIQSEKVNFTSRLPTLTPIIKAQLSPYLDDDIPGKFVRIKPVGETEEQNGEDKIQSRDHQLFQLLQMLLKLCAHCPKFLDQTEDIEDITQYIQTLLAYPHEWVRIAATQFIGYVLSTLNIEHLSNLLANNKSDDVGYLYNDPLNSVKSLTLDLCAQLQPGHVKSEMAEQIIKNLVFMARVLQNVPMGKIDPDDDNDDVKKIVNLFWLTKRMRKIVNREIVEDSKSSILRIEVFKWIAGITATIEEDKIKKVLNHLLAPLVREMSTTENSNAELRQLAKEVSSLLRKKVGHELYISTLSALQMQLNARRAERKRERLQLAVTNPDIAAQKKIKLQEKKKIAKKRKMEGIKGKRLFKRKKQAVDLEESDII